jgi:hypothetical protein
MPQSGKHHPYERFEGSILWQTIEQGIAALVKNGDLEELTPREYIVGSICQAIAGGKDSTDSALGTRYWVLVLPHSLLPINLPRKFRKEIQ